MPKYNVYESKNKIIVVSTFAGRPVRGVAKCSPDDTFDKEKGTALAKARCDYKVAQKRWQRSRRRLAEALEAYTAANNELKKMNSYVDDSYTDLEAARNTLYALESSL